MRPASISISESGRIYRLAVPALQAIVTHLDLRIEREELKVIVDELFRDRMMRLEAVVCQFGANLAKEKPSAELVQFMSGPAAENEEREAYLQGVRDSWEIMSGCDETAYEFAVNFDSIRTTLIQRIRDLDKSKGDMQSDTIKGTDTHTQEYQDFLESEERASGEKLAIAKDEATEFSRPSIQCNHKKCNCVCNCKNNHSVELFRCMPCSLGRTKECAPATS